MKTKQKRTRPDLAGNTHAQKGEEAFSARIIIACSVELKNQVVRAHQAAGRKLSEWVRDAIEEKLEKEK